MWNFLESVGTLFTFFGIVGLIGSLMGGLEMGFGLVFLIFSGTSVLLLVIGTFLFAVGSKLHDKWLKETYPEAWEQNQLLREACRGK